MPDDQNPVAATITLFLSPDQAEPFEGRDILCLPLLAEETSSPNQALDDLLAYFSAQQAMLERIEASADPDKAPENRAARQQLLKAVKGAARAAVYACEIFSQGVMADPIDEVLQ